MSDRAMTLEEREAVERALRSGEQYGPIGLLTGEYRALADAARRYLAVTAGNYRPDDPPRRPMTIAERERVAADGVTVRLTKEGT